MSIMLENNVREQVVIPAGYFRRNKVMPSILGTGTSSDRAVVRIPVPQERENVSVLDPCSSSSSSIGMNSDGDEDVDVHNNNKNGEDDEVESQFNNSPFDSAVDALEQALPIRRGISKFYNGKSKSFASLADAACSSIKDITKQENGYSRKRKNLVAYSIICDKGRNSLCRSPSIGGGIVKKSAISNRSSLAYAVAVNNCDGPHEEHGSVEEWNMKNNSRNSNFSPPLMPVPPPPWRSFSLADLQHCAVSSSATNSNLSSPLMGKRTKPDEVS